VAAASERFKLRLSLRWTLTLGSEFIDVRVDASLMVCGGAHEVTDDAGLMAVVVHRKDRWARGQARGGSLKPSFALVRLRMRARSVRSDSRRVAGGELKSDSSHHLFGEMEKHASAVSRETLLFPRTAYSEHARRGCRQPT
jgi:hypothetical protein